MGWSHIFTNIYHTIQLNIGKYMVNICIPMHPMQINKARYETKRNVAFFRAAG